MPDPLAGEQLLASGVAAGAEPMAGIKGPGKRGGKSNTERSRQYRLAKRQSGGAELSLFINPAAVAALQTIVARDRSTQTQAIERALVALAAQYAPHALAVHDGVPAGVLDDQAPASCALHPAPALAAKFKESV